MSDVLAPAQPAVLKACCADLWAHPGIRLLSGDTLRPGGLDLTRRALDRLALPPATRVLDVGCGPGATLDEMARRGLRPVGVDYSPALAAEAASHAPAPVGDAEGLPFRDGAFGAVFVECVLSAVPDKGRAVAEAARVLSPGGAVVLSDVILSGPLPEPLDSLLGWIACAGGALSFQGYVDALEDAGLRVELAEDHRGALAALLAQARRRLALIRGALGVGMVPPSEPFADPDLLGLGDALLARAAGAVEDAVLGYGLFIARRRPVPADGPPGGASPRPAPRPSP